MIVDGFSNGKSRWKMMHNLDLIFRLLFKISDKVMMVKKINESNNYYARVIIIKCKNKRFAANIIHLFVEARRAETNKWFITNERSELK